MSDSKSAQDIQKIQGDYVGANCRKEVAENGSIDKNVIDGMLEWCKRNPEMEVCNKLCSNPKDYCESKNNTLAYVFIGLTGASIIGFLIFFYLKKNIPMIIFFILFTLFLGLTIWKMVDVITISLLSHEG